MKQCPICHSLAFDDAATCFGCLHEFGPDEQTQPIAKPRKEEPLPFEAPPAFVIQIKPERERSGHTTWTCEVNLVPA